MLTWQEILYVILISAITSGILGFCILRIGGHTYDENVLQMTCDKTGKTVFECKELFH